MPASQPNNPLKMILIVTSVIFLLLAVFFELPDGFYTLLGLIVCGTGAYLTWLAYEKQKWGWLVVFGFIALLFNPVFKVHFEREVWVFIDFMVAVFFGIEGGEMKIFGSKHIEKKLYTVLIKKYLYEIEDSRKWFLLKYSWCYYFVCYFSNSRFCYIMVIS